MTHWPHQVVPLTFAGITNARTYRAVTTVSGQPLRADLLIRSGRLEAATTADRAALQALDVRTVVDLRLSSERRVAPDQPVAGAQAVAAPLASDAVTAAYQTQAALFAFLRTHRGAAGWMRTGYQQMLTDPAQQASLAQVAQLAATAPGRMLVHCSAGKDRTGVTVALLLDALGVSRTLIRQDYLLTNVAAAAHAQALRQALAAAHGTPAMQRELAALGRADPHYLAAVFHLLDTRYHGSRAFFTTTLGLGQGWLRQLQAKFAG